MSLEQAAALTAAAFKAYDRNSDDTLQFDEFATWYSGREGAGGEEPSLEATLAGAGVGAGRGEEEQSTSVLETRLSGFAVHGLVLATLSFASSLRVVPIAVVNGVFLYLGKKVMSGNQFVARAIALAIPEPASLKAECLAERTILILGRRATAAFTGLQLLCLTTLWGLKLTPGLGMIFPAAIAGLMFVRVQALPRLFTRRQLGIIDTPFGSMT